MQIDAKYTDSSRDLTFQKESSTEESPFIHCGIHVSEINKINESTRNLELCSPLFPKPFFSNWLLTKKISFWAISITLFATSAFTACNWAHKTRILTIAMLVNGFSITALCTLCFPSKALKLINKKSAHWCYESLFLVTQIFLNLIPKKLKRPLGSIFNWVYGAMEGKDILHLVTLSQAEFSLSSIPPEETDVLKMVGYTTQNIKGRNRMMLACLVSGIAMSILDFAWLKSKYQDYDDFGKLGIYQDIFAMWTFIPLSTLITGHLCDRKRVLEKEYFNSIRKGKPETLPLKIANLITQILLLSSPVLTISTLAIDTPPNKIETYFLMGIAAFSTAQAAYISREEFENLNSPLHSIKEISDVENSQLLSQKDKVISWMSKYGASLLFEIGFISFFIAVLVDSPNDWIAISGTISMSIIAFIFTDRLAAHYRPQRDNRILNEIAFQILYFPLWASFIYEYITTKLNIDDQSLNRDSKELYAMATAGWWTLGTLIGINRATHIQDKSYSFANRNPGIFTMEMTKFLFNRLNA